MEIAYESTFKQILQYVRCWIIPAFTDSFDKCEPGLKYQSNLSANFSFIMIC